jgi:hypothetical protein
MMRCEPIFFRELVQRLQKKTFSSVNRGRLCDVSRELIAVVSLPIVR